MVKSLLRTLKHYTKEHFFLVWEYFDTVMVYSNLTKHSATLFELLTHTFWVDKDNDTEYFTIISLKYMIHVGKMNDEKWMFSNKW